MTPTEIMALSDEQLRVEVALVEGCKIALCGPGHQHNEEGPWLVNGDFWGKADALPPYANNREAIYPTVERTIKAVGMRRFYDGLVCAVTHEMGKAFDELTVAEALALPILATPKQLCQAVLIAGMEDTK